MFSRICVCDICDSVELTDKAQLPDGWVILWDSPATVCDSCLGRWTERWEEPAVWFTGGEKELTLL